MPPASRITDMHTCPMVTGVVPHVGGPILPPGEPTVLIGMLPAARMTDMLTCVGPPDTILMGSPTVLIGNLMAARIGDPTVHGGVIVLGEPTVEIGEVGMGTPTVVTPAPPLVILAQAMAAPGSAAAQAVSSAAQDLAEGAQSASPTVNFTLANQPLAQAAGAAPPSPLSTGQHIAAGHAYDKHVVERGEFPEVTNRQEFAQLIDDIIDNPSVSKSLSSGRSACWEAEKGTVVIINPVSADGGTCFRPAGGIAYFQGLK